jgi:hypothetical protein
LFLVSNPLEDSGSFVEDSSIIKNKGRNRALWINFVEVFAGSCPVGVHVYLLHTDVDTTTTAAMKLAAPLVTGV